MHLRREERSHHSSKEEMESNITFYRDSQSLLSIKEKISLTKESLIYFTF